MLASLCILVITWVFLSSSISSPLAHSYVELMAACLMFRYTISAVFSNEPGRTSSCIPNSTIPLFSMGSSKDLMLSIAMSPSSSIWAIFAASSSLLPATLASTFLYCSALGPLSKSLAIFGVVLKPRFVPMYLFSPDPISVDNSISIRSKVS